MCVKRVEFVGKKRRKGTASLEAKARKKIGPKPDRKRLVPEGVRDFLGWKPRNEYPPSRRLTWMRTAGLFVAHLGTERVPEGDLGHPLPWRCGL